MWIRIHIYALVLFMGCFLFGNPDVINAAPSVLSTDYTDSALVYQNTSINVNAQKGEITVKHWDKPMIWVKVIITFENQNLEIAQKELEYVRYNFQKTATEVNISNYFSLPPGIGKISSKVKVDYLVYLPDKVTLVITNQYGSCSVNNMNCNLIINNEYGNIVLSNVKGRMRVFADLCDVIMNGFSGNVEMFSAKSDITLIDINGTAIINNKVGTVYIEPGKLLNSLKVSTSYSEVNVLVKDLYRFNYDLTAKHAKIELGDKFKRFPFKRKSKEKLVYRSEVTNHEIEIITSYNSIKLH